MSEGVSQKYLVNSEDQLELISGFFAKQQADFLYSQLLSSLAWKQEQITVVGRKVLVPRLVCWYGDKQAVYTYSGVAHQPLPWNGTLLDIKQHIETFSSFSFNSVLANLYRNGSDSMGWHADKEKELGKDPAVASLSLGDQRLFKIRRNKTGEMIDIELQHGDLLLMSGALQHHWRHCVPKTKHEKKPRINLMFRKILQP